MRAAWPHSVLGRTSTISSSPRVDVARNVLKTEGGPLSVVIGARRFTVASDDGDEFASALGLSSVTECSNADLVIISGSQADKVPLEEYRKLLAPAARRTVRVCESRQTDANSQRESAWSRT